MRDEDIEQAADLFLTLWQENIRLWATEKDLLPHAELAALLEVPLDRQAPDQLDKAVQLDKKDAP